MRTSLGFLCIPPSPFYGYGYGRSCLQGRLEGVLQPGGKLLGHGNDERAVESAADHSFILSCMGIQKQCIMSCS